MRIAILRVFSGVFFGRGEDGPKASLRMWGGPTSASAAATSAALQGQLWGFSGPKP